MFVFRREYEGLLAQIEYWKLAAINAREDARKDNQREMAAMEASLKHWQELFDAERVRADRLQDQLLLIHGEAPVTETVRVEKKAENAAQETEDVKRAREMQEIFAEQMNETGDGSGMLEAEVGIELPDEFKSVAETPVAMTTPAAQA